ncbi:hypothetical protein NQ315_015600 [Exocentrus adspersus]|uniref:HAT C-terminal dimerisation domain-containing protein n=1 Tax=Exocentrus adspersus TaxID=1586481 RepID=A0AAV8VET6_9CUCU|nr:hypothetical protein NQ315_015600 [Exocentrus adspersus]
MEAELALSVGSGVPHKARCTSCKTEFKAETTVIKNHSRSIKHIRSVSTINDCTQPKISSAFENSCSNVQERTKSFEIWLATFLAEHNVAFNSIDDLVAGLKLHLNDSVVQSMKLGRTKATAIINNVVGKVHKVEIEEDLRNGKFSLLIDESTDRGTIKSVCICVRYNVGHSVKTKLLSLVDIFDKNDFDSANEGATAQRLYDCVMKVIKDANINEKNLIGFASDGCNTMMGVNNSFSRIMILKCICHSLHICASKACEELPRMCEDLARDVYAYFKNSSKRQCQFIEFQIFCDAKVHRILRPSQTRWLSLLSVVNRIVEQWDALKLFFNSQWHEHKTLASEHISIALNNPLIKLYYLFLQWVLPKIVQLNELFQSEKVIITDLYTNMKRMYVDLLRIGVMQYMSNANLSKEATSDFFERCRRFLICLCGEIKRRFDFNDKILSNISIFNPKYGQSANSVSLFSLLKETVRLTDDMDIQVIDDEYRMFNRDKNDLPDYIKSICEVDTYWIEVGKLQNFDQSFRYKNLSTYVLRLLVLPHSNAACERVFSKVNLVKTDIRNKLKTNTISNILLASQKVKDMGGCHRFKPDDLISYMTKDNLYNNNNSEEMIDVAPFFE